MKYLSTFLIVIVLCFNANGQNNSQWFSLDGGVKTVEGETGIGINGKFSFEISRFFAELNPLDLTFVPQDPSGNYRSETTSDGREICRDANTGQFASKENCAISFKTFYAFSGNVNYMLKEEDILLYVGPGYRLGKATTPYVNVGLIFGTVPFSRSQHWFAKSSIGKNFFELSVGVSFGL